MEIEKSKIFARSLIFKQIYSFLLSLFIIAGVLFSSVAISDEIHHHCHQPSCSVCYNISIAKSFISGLNLGENLIFISLIALLCISAESSVKGIIPRAITLVSLKVKLSN